VSAGGSPAPRCSTSASGLQLCPLQARLQPVCGSGCNQFVAATATPLWQRHSTFKRVVMQRPLEPRCGRHPCTREAHIHARWKRTSMHARSARPCRHEVDAHAGAKRTSMQAQSGQRSMYCFAQRDGNQPVGGAQALAEHLPVYVEIGTVAGHTQNRQKKHLRVGGRTRAHLEQTQNVTCCRCVVTSTHGGLVAATVQDWDRGMTAALPGKDH